MFCVFHILVVGMSSQYTNKERFTLYVDTPEKPGDAEQEKGSERRRHPRFRVGVFTELAREDSPKIPSVTYDMSRSGASLLTAAPVGEGELVLLSFISVDDECQSRVCRVVHESAMERSSMWCHRIGVEFDRDVPKFFREEIEGRSGLHLVH